ncbi:EscU/YscU/HrcU family type III secretion system export apparatus switch protein [Shigella sp. FC1967]|uniref:EscU/YscU/HrcU family type III secretion system export apparatus switch protein n=1 Tax=Shigella sp. FC1967 TaxID=1898041 RepID=UPI00336AB8E4
MLTLFQNYFLIFLCLFLLLLFYPVLFLLYLVHVLKLATEAIKIDLNNINPISGFKKNIQYKNN